MKLWQKLTLAVVASAVAAVIMVFALKSLVRERTAVDTLPQGRTIQELQACTSDSDCITVDKTCCSCGDTFVINKMFTDTYRRSLSCFNAPPNCPAKTCELPQNAKCIENVCAAG